jgi:hypothetical protein
MTPQERKSYLALLQIFIDHTLRHAMPTPGAIQAMRARSLGVTDACSGRDWTN